MHGTPSSAAISEGRSGCQLYFYALEDALDLQLPRQDIRQGTVRAAQWASRNS
ncbi:hypothetical protein ABZZ17_25005 [Streptomyces sp. NPDC006512]|uniref:hypothetical protein n=1 Tax=Streptomyces sp. NPDC006512 TaxID=3154307 RepID=UPI0033BAF076